MVVQRVAEITGGASLAANVALIQENARVGALMAIELARLRSAFSRPVFPRSSTPGTLIDPSKTAAVSSPLIKPAVPKAESFVAPKKPVAPVKTYTAPVAEVDGSSVWDDSGSSDLDSSDLDSDVPDVDSHGVWSRQTRRSNSIASSLKPNPVEKPARDGKKPYGRDEKKPYARDDNNWKQVGHVVDMSLWLCS